MAFKMKNPSIMKMAKMAGNPRVAMKMKQQDAAMKMKKDPMKMKKDPMKMKDPMDMKKDPMMMKKDPMMMKKDPMKMKTKKDPKRPVAEKIRDVEPRRKGRTVTKTKTRRIDGAKVTKTKGPGFREKSVMKMKKDSAMKMKKGSAMKKDDYDKALKKDPKLPEYIKKRKSLTKGTPEYNANQNKINAAYGKGPMRDVKEKVTTLGTRKVTKIDTPGVERLKIVDTNKKKKTKKKNLITGIVTKFKRKRGKDKKFNTADDKVKTKSRKMFRETKLGKTKLGQKLVSKKNK